jgi:hypothetical protein
VTLAAAAHLLAARTTALGRKGHTLTTDERERLIAAIPAFPGWLLELLSTVPLCGLELGWQASKPEWDDDGLAWVRISDADGILKESLELYPGLAILPAGYLNLCGDATGGGDPYFIPMHEGEDPPLYQVYHDVGEDADSILAAGRVLVAPRLSEFFRTAVLGG